MAFVRSRVQRSIGGSFSRVGLGAGDDRVHAVSRLANRRGRPSPNFFPWRLCLSGCPRGHGLHDDKMAGACRRLVSFGHRGGTRHAGADRRRAPIFDYATTLDLILDDLHGHERWLYDCGTHLRLRPPNVRSTWSFKSIWITDNYLPDDIPGKLWVCVPAYSVDFFTGDV